MKKTRTLFLTLLLAAFQLSVYAQSTKVQGVVNDSQNLPMPGVTVLIVGTSQGVITDAEGKFSLDAEVGAKIRFSFVGFKSREITVDGSQNNYTITLQEGVELGEITVLGSRNKSRTVIESPVPIDVLDIPELVNTAPQLNVNQILNYVAPSFTSTTQTVSDGTDHIDPAALRGLGPDQVLVLVNGKRRHTSSLVNVNGTVGRGSVGTDLNAIPAYAIKRIEVLRDGAAAQYGSDAIAGVINIVLKDQTDGLEMAVNGGMNNSAGGNNHTGGIDGEQVQLNANYGIPLTKNGGFVNFTGTLFTRNPTYRAGKDGFSGSIFNAYNAIERVAGTDGFDVANLDFEKLKSYGQQVTHFDAAFKSKIAGAEDLSALQKLLQSNVTDAELAARGQTRMDYSMQVGQSALRSGQLMSNLQLPIGENFRFYSFGGLSYRNGQAAGFYRRPDQSRANTLVYPNGFLPQIHSNVADQSMAVGIQGKTATGWDLDFSNTWGRNAFEFNIANSSNATMNRSTPLAVYAGGFAFQQNTTNVDFAKYFSSMLNGTNIAFGMEYRFENYQLMAGQQESYARYDKNGDVVRGNTPDDLLVRDALGRTRPGGIQVFPGFKPTNERNKYRNSYAAYFDFESDLSDKVMIGLAGRYENYSDFGDTFNGKFTSRFGISDHFSLRMAASTGFRAPSLHQLHFNATSTNFINGIPFDVGTFSNDSRIAQLLGIPKLKQEKSLSGSMGVTADIPATDITISLDGYYTGVQDRVVLTGNFARPSKATTGAQRELQRLFDAANSTRARFFANAIDTETMGVDLVVSHKISLGAAMLTNNLALNMNQTRQVGDIKASKVLADAGLTKTYFGERDRIFFEQAMPRTKANLTHSLKANKLTVFLRNTYFGQVTNPNKSSDAKEYPVYGGKIVTDLSIGYDLTSDTNLTVGANNLFDVYADMVTPDLTSGNNFIYPRATSQFGMNGRYLFFRLNFSIR